MSGKGTAFLGAAFWPGLGQLSAGRRRLGLGLSFSALGLAHVALSPYGKAWAPSAVLGWIALWAWGMGDLLAVLVVIPARRERADRLLRAGVAYLLRGDSARALGSLERAVALGGQPAAVLYLAEAERRQGHHRRASRRLSALAASPKGRDWRWEVERARMSTEGGAG